MAVNLKTYYKTSDQVITRKIEDDLIIVPLNDGIGDLDAEMFSLNVTGIAIWEKLDGTKSLDTVIAETAKDFNISFDHIKEDVVELVEKLLKLGFLVKL
ncbi:MAG: PqqD family protein [Desulfobacula sp.]|jgi:hypothetical protein|uniref:PqqD family protein n=1 Tax=Desulfobacula sp. TaxID=2593537 RepID=UPI001D50C5B2|nr:PqqD family protein [Desulfobacula sp.]MBT3806668.1 PqqD family protein [Desulfobacula sp.]MBT4505956.1 PqqD family protein [Desulfobacula sp.]MBT5971012.1 PqqD family protein [Desulfobacula sp.]MBT6341105.1 PqqD family protein [Desulfobacula sp.]